MYLLYRRIGPRMCTLFVPDWRHHMYIGHALHLYAWSVRCGLYFFWHYSLCSTATPCCVKRVSVCPNSLCNQLRHTDICCRYACVIWACFMDRSGASDCRECSLSLIFGTRGLPLARDVIDAYSGRGGKSRARARDLEIKIAKHSTLETRARVYVSKVFIV